MAESLEPAAPGNVGATLVDIRAVADTLHCSTRHVSRMCDAGKMPPPVRLGALVRWRASDIGEWVAKGCPSCRLTNPKKGA